MTRDTSWKSAGGQLLRVLETCTQQTVRHATLSVQSVQVRLNEISRAALICQDRIEFEASVSGVHRREWYLILDRAICEPRRGPPQRHTPPRAHRRSVYTHVISLSPTAGSRPGCWRVASFTRASRRREDGNKYVVLTNVQIEAGTVLCQFCNKSCRLTWNAVCSW